MTDDYMLGDSTLHQRVCALTEILGKFVATAPRSLSLAQLHEGSGRAEHEIIAHCAALSRAELLQPHPELSDCWLLRRAPDQVTLEDVFRCVMAEQSLAASPIAASAPSRASPPAQRLQRLHYDADLLVMQAAMAINQSVFQHLRQVSLDRLKMSTGWSSAMPSEPVSHARALR